MTNVDLVIVVLNYRTPALTIDCLASLSDKQAELPRGFHVLLVENGSGDGSADQLAAAIADRGWTTWVTLMPLADNRGFAGGNNAALDLLNSTYAAAPFALLLNSDTIVHPGALRHGHAVMTADPKIGVMSCQLQSPDGSIQNATRMFPTPLKQSLCAFGLPWVWRSRFAWADIYDVPDALLHTKRDAEWLCGAFMFLRTEALKHDIYIVPGKIFSLNGEYSNYIRLSFGRPWNEETEYGIMMLGKLIKKMI